MGGTNLTNINYSTIGNVKFIDTMKYYKLLLVGKVSFHMKKLIQSTLCKNDPKTKFFFLKKNCLSRLRDNLLIKNTTIIQKNCFFFLLKMRNLSDLNDLYNVQDITLLMVIIENRFQETQNETGYNPKKISAASKLSGCIQREQPKCILALPNNNWHVKIFEKTLSEGFSSVNTRFSFSQSF